MSDEIDSASEADEAKYHAVSPAVEPPPAPPENTTHSREESEEGDDQALVDCTAADSISNDIGPLFSDIER